MNWFAFGDALAQGRQQRKQIDAQREIEKFNIRNDEQNARLVGQQTSAREEQSRREGRQVHGTQRAAIAQSGVGFGGSSSDIMRQSTTNAELDALNIRYAGNLERYGILNEIEMRKYNDKLLEQKGKQVMRMRWGTAMAGLFGGGGGQQGGGNYGARASSTSTGMTYNAPATSQGNSWMNAYGASSYQGSGYSGYSVSKKPGG